MLTLGLVGSRREGVLASVSVPAVGTTDARGKGRPRVTSHAQIEEVAFALFDERGFEATTMDEVAAAAGIGRRTLFRYYPSKNDVPWGRFDSSLVHFAAHLRERDDLPLGLAVREAVVQFNAVPPEALEQHRRRMTLLLRTPALMAHSELRYAAWRAVVAEFVAERLGTGPRDLRAVVFGRTSLGSSLSADDVWLETGDTRLEDLLRTAFDLCGLSRATDSLGVAADAG